MKTVIAGSRDIELFEVVRYAILSYHKDEITEVVSGGARGVDRLGEQFGEEFDIPIKQFIPNYEDYPSHIAPFKRNASMGYYADNAVIIWDGESKGTKHMMKCMLEEQKPFTLVKIKLDYLRYQDTIVRTYEFDDGARFAEYPDGKFKTNIKAAEQ